MKTQTAVIALAAWLGDPHLGRLCLMESAQYMRILLMDLVVLLVMRFAPGEALPMGRYSK